jgi:signal transduction histidine kinase
VTGLEVQRRRIDRVLLGLLLLQWMIAGGTAWILKFKDSPTLTTHDWVAVALAAIPVWLLAVLVWFRPGTALTRRTMAAGQLLLSGLLLHFSGGRPEVIYHIFCGLGLLAFYLDPPLLILAAAIATAEAALQGLFWPIPNGAWRWLEQGAWIFLGAFILSRYVRQSLAMRLQLAEYAKQEVSFSKQTAEREKLDVLNKELIESSREAGMAEIATSVLHNVGNVLNSVNISGVVISERARRSKAGELIKLAALLKQNEPTMVEFLTTDPRGKRIPDLIERFADALLVEQGELIAEAEGLAKNIAHIRDIVAMQQSYASISGLRELVSMSSLLDDAVQINAGELQRNNIEIVRDYEEAPPLLVDKSKVMQIFVNLIANAWQAIVEQQPEKRLLTVKIARDRDGSMAISVRDNGVGIPFENLTRIFAHGFTTKRKGHGFGLHSGALLAKEMGGSLTADSHGPGVGATFTLKLPLAEDTCVQAAA